MRGIGVAVEQLDGARRSLHEGVVDFLRDHHRAHRDGAVGEALGAGDDVGHHVEFLRGEGRAGAAEAGDHFVEDQQQAVFVADLAQAFQISLRWQYHARGARDGLDDHSSDGGCIVQRYQPLELIGEFRAVRGQAAREGVAFEVMRVRQVIDAGNHGRGPHLAIRDHAADADATESHAVIAALAPDETYARGVAFDPVIRQRDLERRIDRLGARIGEEHVIETRGSDPHQRVGQVEGRRDGRSGTAARSPWSRAAAPRPG